MIEIEIPKETREDFQEFNLLCKTECAKKIRTEKDFRFCVLNKHILGNIREKKKHGVSSETIL